MASLSNLAPRQHIQDHDSAEAIKPYWGYADRVVPCTNDPGSCEYLDVVYGAHEIGMMYTGILWATILGIIFAAALWRYYSRPTASSFAVSTDNIEATGGGSPSSRLRGFRRLRSAAGAWSKQHLLPDAARPIFGRTTRFQVVVLAALTGYLAIWSFVGITWNTWVTPVKDMPGVNNTRSSLGPWSDRIGVLAYALTPLSVMLASRENALSLLLGVPYQSFNFLHRWLGYIIFVQAALHTIGWTIIEVRLYQPQPTVGEAWIKQVYMIWGVVAMILLTLLFVLSLPFVIRKTGYEFFRKAHYVLAMVYIGACWGHWEKLKCFLLPSLIFWFLDRIARLVRTGFLHYHHLPEGSMGFRSVPATMTMFPDAEGGDVVRMELENDQDAWAIGQHFYLCFPTSSIWQSHPFTPLNNPIVRDGKVKHSYLLRAKGGETKKIAALGAKQAATEGGMQASTSVILTGPYGEDNTSRLSSPETNIMCVAGGTGITYVLPVLLELARQPVSPDRRIELVWAMRHADNTAWVQEELNLLRPLEQALNLKIRLYATRDRRTTATLDSNSGSDADEKKPQTAIDAASSDEPGCDCGEEVPVKKIGGGAADMERHPDLKKLVNEFVASTVKGPTTVFASGPGGMISDLRSIVSGCASGSKVWNGDERFDVGLVCDDRLEW
ncbi:hypothetical protein N3K66_000304 [Trichothecium roseum]|uniref:Uncharacterized protein n=1 Tax=Trichothecium roseum TaxID=47278 RepID=A0ACC0VBH3_9HYPO|nr:hypothetical protein N3K66_000304 [Trichothecium roseum]